MSLPHPNRQMQARARSAPGKQQQTKGKGDKSSGVCGFEMFGGGRENEVGLSNSK